MLILLDISIFILKCFNFQINLTKNEKFMNQGLKFIFTLNNISTNSEFFLKELDNKYFNILNIF